MQTQPETTIAEFIRYNNWANQQVLAACQSLSQGLQTPPDMDGWGYLWAHPDRFEMKQVHRRPAQSCRGCDRLVGQWAGQSGPHNARELHLALNGLYVTGRQCVGMAVKILDNR